MEIAGVAVLLTLTKPLELLVIPAQAGTQGEGT